MIRILFFTVGTEIIASSRTRVYQYFPYLKNYGFKMKVIPYNSEKMSRLSIKRNGQIEIISRFIRKMSHLLRIGYFLFFVPFYDIIFIQKVIFPLLIQRILKKMQARLIFDFDDAIYTDHQTMDVEKEKEFMNRLINIIKVSEYVIVENDYTKQFAFQYNENILTITGPIDCKRYFPREKSNSDHIVIGWIGSPFTTIYLQSLYDVFRRVSKKYPNVIIELIGASKIRIEGVNIVLKEWDLETEVENLQNFDIGIMPLSNDEWTRGKGGHKLLQYMAVGIPCITSPVGINRKLILEAKNGFLADSEEEWVEKMEILINNPDLRARMGQIGRKIADEEYSFDVGAPKLARIFKKLNESIS